MIRLLAVTVLAIIAMPLLAQDSSDTKVYELRTYTAAEGKLPELLARFRNHTLRLFEKHGMKNVAYWVPIEGERSKDTLIYVLEHASSDAAEASWAAFRADPEWLKVKQASEANGPLITKVEGIYMKETDFSRLR
jgi:hypothetical protein